MEAQKELRKKGFTTLNAIGEELFDKRTYKDAAMKRRCLVLSSGFYEWRHYKPTGAKKPETYPYYITVPGCEYFFMAVIWQPWTDKETGETMDTFSIVTTKANSLMAEVHNKKERMPTILPDDLAIEWMRGDLSKERITELATYQFPADKMQAHTIHKEFRDLEDPEMPFEYTELPPIGTDPNTPAIGLFA
jgi:putative SOS response-associated peptidase YedK